MLIDFSQLLVWPSLALLPCLAVLVLGKRVVRGIVERRSRRRRVRWVRALGTGPVSEMCMRELRLLARGAARSRAAQDDLLSLVAGGRLPPRDERRAPYERALTRAGFKRALRRACASRRAVTRGRAALLWAGLGLPGAERQITPLTADEDRDVCAAAVQALGACRSEEAAWALLGALRDRRVAPERVVERLTGDWASGPLLSALRRPEFAHVRPWLAEALGLTGDPRAELPLIELAATGDEPERIRACRALGRLGLPSSAEVLIGALSDDSDAVRAQAARALAGLRDKRGIHALVQLLGDRSWWVRARAAEALRELGSHGMAALRWSAATHPDPYARARALEALACEHGAERRQAAA